MDSSDIFRVRTSHGTAPQLPTIQRLSNQALSRFQSAPVLLYGVQETIPRGPFFSYRGSGWHPAEQHRSPHRTFLGCWYGLLRRCSAQFVPKTKASSTATDRALRCHTREAVEFCFLGVPFFFRYPYMVGPRPDDRAGSCYAAALFSFSHQKTALSSISTAFVWIHKQAAKRVPIMHAPSSFLSFVQRSILSMIAMV